MNLQFLADNLLNPPILFFFLGFVAVLIKSDLEIPPALSRFFSLYLLLAIGFKGGVELAHSGFSWEIAGALLASMLMAFAVPVYTFFILKKSFNVYNAAAIAATYGSVSAVTFITAVSFLNDLQQPYGGYMVAALALMESPAIVVAVAFAQFYKNTSEKASNRKRGGQGAMAHVIKDAFTNGSVVLILGSLLIGLLTGEKGSAALSPFTGDIFKGMLSFFLLDMGLLAARRVRSVLRIGGFAIAFGLLMPLFNGLLGIGISWLIGLSLGDALLFTVLCAGASYIAVPAAMRTALPRANPGVYVPMALAITFPFNIIIGIPLYYYLASLLIPS